MEITSKHLSERPPRFSEVNPSISVPDWLERTVFKMLAKLPDERFLSMTEFQDAIKQVQR